MKRIMLSFVVLFNAVAFTTSQAQELTYGSHSGTDWPLCPPASDYRWPPAPAPGNWTNAQNYHGWEGVDVGCYVGLSFGTHSGTDWPLCPPTSDYRWTPAPTPGTWTNAQNYLGWEGFDAGCYVAQEASTDTPADMVADGGSGADLPTGGSSLSRQGISSKFVGGGDNSALIQWESLSDGADAAVDIGFYKNNAWSSIATSKWTNSGWINRGDWCSSGCNHSAVDVPAGNTLYRLVSTDSNGSQVIDYRLLNHSTGSSAVAASGGGETIVTASLPRNDNDAFTGHRNIAYSDSQFNYPNGFSYRDLTTAHSSR